MSGLPLCWVIGIELTKLALQFSGALLVAWLAVRWALGRYKAEKLWERKLSAYSDVIMALGQMRRSIGNAIDQWELRRDTRDWPEHFSQDTRTVANVIAIARFLLPEDVTCRLNEYEKAYYEAEDNYHGDPTDILDPQYQAITTLLDFLIDRGREDVGSVIR